MDPREIAQLPFAAFLILLGITFFGLLGRGILRWERDVTKAEKSETEWKDIAKTATSTAAAQGEQITKLTELVEAISRSRGLV